jgi:dprA: DNA protecting protein DprA
MWDRSHLPKRKFSVILWNVCESDSYFWVPARQWTAQMAFSRKEPNHQWIKWRNPRHRSQSKERIADHGGLRAWSEQRSVRGSRNDHRQTLPRVSWIDQARCKISWKCRRYFNRIFRIHGIFTKISKA